MSTIVWTVEHRVRIKSSEDARVSVAIFYNPTGFGDYDLLGPSPSLSLQKSHRSFTMEEFMDSQTKFGHGRSSTDHFKCCRWMLLTMFVILQTDACFPLIINNSCQPLEEPLNIFALPFCEVNVRTQLSSRESAILKLSQTMPNYTYATQMISFKIPEVCAISIS